MVSFFMVQVLLGLKYYHKDKNVCTFTMFFWLVYLCFLQNKEIEYLLINIGTIRAKSFQVYFSNFQIVSEDLNWNDYDLIFPI